MSYCLWESTLPLPGVCCFDESPRSQVWIPSYIAYGLVDTMAPLYGVMAPMAGNLGMEQGKFIGWLNQVIGQTTNESLGDLPFSTCFWGGWLISIIMLLWCFMRISPSKASKWWCPSLSAIGKFPWYSMIFMKKALMFHQQFRIIHVLYRLVKPFSFQHRKGANETSWPSQKGKDGKGGKLANPDEYLGCLKVLLEGGGSVRNPGSEKRRW